jgi:hypothetical protein
VELDAQRITEQGPDDLIIDSEIVHEDGTTLPIRLLVSPLAGGYLVRGIDREIPAAGNLRLFLDLWL